MKDNKIVMTQEHIEAHTKLCVLIEKGITSDEEFEKAKKEDWDTWQDIYKTDERHMDALSCISKVKEQNDKLKEFNEFILLRVRDNITLDKLIEYLKCKALTYTENS